MPTWYATDAATIVRSRAECFEAEEPAVRAVPTVDFGDAGA